MNSTSSTAAHSTDPLAIVGGGISGLSAAYYALQKGVPGEHIHIYEASSRAGGKISSDTLQGRLVNKGAEFIDSDQEKMLALCGELGVKLNKSDDQGTLRFQLPNGQIMEGDAFLDAYRPISERIIAHKKELQRHPDGKLARALEHMSLDNYLNWLAEHTAAKPERSFLRMLFDSITFNNNRVDPNIIEMAKQCYASEAGNNPQNINAMQFINEASSELDAIFSSDCAYRVEGGTETIIHALKQKLTESGVHFHANTPIESVRKQADGRTQISVGGENARSIAAEKVIFALPTYALNKVQGLESLGFSPQAKDIIAKTQYTNSIKFTVALKDGVVADSANFFSSKGYQCWSADSNQLTFLCNADEVSSGKTNMKAFVESRLTDYAFANGKSPDALFHPVNVETVSLSNPGKSPCYASPAPGQLSALEELGGSLDALAENGVGIAGSFLPHRSPDGLTVGFMECGLNSAQHACDMLLTQEKTRGSWMERFNQPPQAATLMAQRSH
jgi:monoamine oxidase